jgi:hypothetical protein
VVYCVAKIIAGGEQCTFERLVYEAFTQFPDSFGLKRYPEWPDSARVNKSWLRCRTDKGWIVGNVQEGFRLTPAGDVIVRLVASRVGEAGTGVSSDHHGRRTRERFEALLRSVRAEPIFRRFAQGDSQGVTLMELRQLLGATLETPTRVLKQNIKAYRAAAEAYHDEQVLDFLGMCERIVSS